MLDRPTPPLPFSRLYWLALALGATLASAQPSLVRQAAIEAQLAPPRANLATLARDGRHIAYTLNAGGQTRIEIVAIDPPYQKHRIYLGDTRGARVLSLAWTSAHRIVFATEDWAIATASITDEFARVVLDPNTFTATLAGDLDQLNEDNPLSIERYPRPPRLLGLAPDAEDEVIVEGVVGQHLRNATASTARAQRQRNPSSCNLSGSAQRLFSTSSVSVPISRAPISSIHRLAGRPSGMPTESRKIPIHSRLVGNSGAVTLMVPSMKASFTTKSTPEVPSERKPAPGCTAPRRSTSSCRRPRPRASRA